MMQSQMKGFVFTRDYRLLDRWIMPIGIAILAAISLHLLILSITSEEHKSNYLVVGIFLLGICVLLALSKSSNLKLLNMSYSYENKMLINRCKSEMHCIKLNNSIFITELPVVFSIKGTWTERFFVLSSYPFSQIRSLESGGLQTIKNLWKYGVIILPANEETQELITQITDIVQIPQYPKVAYLQRGDT